MIVQRFGILTYDLLILAMGSYNTPVHRLELYKLAAVLQDLVHSMDLVQTHHARQSLIVDTAAARQKHTEQCSRESWTRRVSMSPGHQYRSCRVTRSTTSNSAVLNTWRIRHTLTKTEPANRGRLDCTKFWGLNILSLPFPYPNPLPFHSLCFFFYSYTQKCFSLTWNVSFHGYPEIQAPA